jgi:hypothetical protein
VLLLDQIEKKETLLAILLNDLEFQNKYDLTQRNDFKKSKKSFSHIGFANLFEHDYEWPLVDFRQNRQTK